MPYWSKQRKEIEGGCAMIYIFLIILYASSGGIKWLANYYKNSKHETATTQTYVDSLVTPKYELPTPVEEHEWYTYDILPIPRSMGTTGDSCYVSSFHWYFVKNEYGAWKYGGEMFQPPKPKPSRLVLLKLLDTTLKK